jgi:hypothetical protein
LSDRNNRIRQGGKRMAYEYSTQGATLDFPNPHRIENLFMALRGAVLLACGLVLLWLAREAGQAVSLQRAELGQGQLLLMVVGGALLVVLGILEIAQMARQLRVFFGRGQPASLAPDLARDIEGGSPAARNLVEQIRHGAIALAVPQGALNGMLYALLRHLVTAPVVLRRFVEVRFANLLACVGLLALFGLTWLFTPGPAARALSAAVYLALGSSLVLRTYLRGSSGVVALSPLSLAGLLVFGIVGTVLLGRVVTFSATPAWLEHLALPTIALVLLLASIVIEALGLVAGRAHVDEPPPASTANEQTVVSFNADPNLLVQEVDRELQQRWEQGIPNRRYAWQPPVIEPGHAAGNFSATLLEECQPMPPQAVKVMDWATCLAFPRFYWLAAMDALGLLLTLLGGLLWVGLARQWIAGQEANTALGSMGFIFLVVGGYALRVAHQLWGRLDFESTLTWLEFNGSYARAQVGLGGQWTDRVRSERSVVNVESMTLRAWVVSVRSVIFSYRDHSVGSRMLVGMQGDIDAARLWTQQVREFAQAQSSVVVPGAHEDARRLQALAAANTLAGSAPAVALPGAPAPTALTHSTPASPANRHCTQCGTALDSNARFCPQCGTGVMAAAP